MPTVPIPTKVPAEINCINCGYHLVGLPVAGDCPECATPIRRSMFERLLRHEPIVWLSRVASGIQIWHTGISRLLVLPLVGLGVMVLVIVLEQFRDPLFTKAIDRIIGEVIAYGFLAALAFFTLLYIRGIWLMTTPRADETSVVGGVRKQTRWLAVSVPFLFAASAFTEDFMLDPIAPSVLDGLITAGFVAYVWTSGRMFEALSNLVWSMKRTARTRLRLAHRDGWIVITICALAILFAGFNPILLVMYLYFCSVHGALGGLKKAIQLERQIALEHHAKESRPSSAETVDATD